MAHMSQQKIKLLVLYDLLCRLTDENHALNTDEIISLLVEKNIAVSRKILLQDIALLNEYGYEILTYKKNITITTLSTVILIVPRLRFLPMLCRLPS